MVILGVAQLSLVSGAKRFFKRCSQKKVKKTDIYKEEPDTDTNAKEIKDVKVKSTLKKRKRKTKKQKK